MKKLTILFAALALFTFTDCKLYDAATSSVNLSATHETGVVDDDQIVVRSEQALAVGLDTFDTFLKVEYQNRELFAKIPGAHAAAENVRRNGKRWIKSLEAAHDAYKGNRNSLNHANLITAWRTVQTSIDEVKSYMATAAKKGA